EVVVAWWAPRLPNTSTIATTPHAIPTPTPISTRTLLTVHIFKRDEVRRRGDGARGVAATAARRRASAAPGGSPERRRNPGAARPRAAPRPRCPRREPSARAPARRRGSRAAGPARGHPPRPRTTGRS